MPTTDFLNKAVPNIVRSVHILSWAKIDVFNKHDLQMSNHFFTVNSSVGGQGILIPHTDEKGRRLSWHSSDKVYFGNSLRWRRMKNSQPLLPVTQRDKLIYCQILVWAEKFNFSDNSSLLFNFYKSKWPYEKNGVYVFPKENKVGFVTVNTQSCAG